MYEALKVLHVLAVITLGGAIIVDTMTGVFMGRAQRVQDLRPLTRLSRANQFVGEGGTLLLIAFGYATAAKGDWDLGATWLLIAQVLVWGIFALSLLLLVRPALRLATEVEQLPEGPLPDHVARELKNPMFPVLGTLFSIAFVFVLYLMVAKPGW